MCCFHNMTPFTLFIKYIKLIWRWFISRKKFIILVSMITWHTHKSDWHNLMVNLFTFSIATWHLSIYRSFNFLTCCSNCCKSLPAAALLPLHKYSEVIEGKKSAIGSSLIPTLSFFWESTDKLTPFPRRHNLNQSVPVKMLHYKLEWWIKIENFHPIPRNLKSVAWMKWQFVFASPLSSPFFCVVNWNEMKVFNITKNNWP